MTNLTETMDSFINTYENLSTIILEAIDRRRLKNNIAMAIKLPLLQVFAGSGSKTFVAPITTVPTNARPSAKFSPRERQGKER